MNAFLQKFFIDYGLLISSSPLLPIKDIVKNRARLKFPVFSV